MDESLRTMMRQHLTQKREKGGSMKDKVKAMKQQKDLPVPQKSQPQVSSASAVVREEPEANGNNDSKKSSSIPQGFFDDPIEDLKAQGIIKSYSEFKELRQKHDQDEFQSFMSEIEHITNEVAPSSDINDATGSGDDAGNVNETVEVLPGNNILDPTENDILQYAYITKLASLYHQSEVVMKKYQPPTSSSSTSVENPAAIQEMLQDVATLAQQEEMIIHTTGVTLSDTTMHNFEEKSIENPTASSATVTSSKPFNKRKAYEKEEDLTDIILQQLRKKKSEKRKP